MNQKEVGKRIKSIRESKGITRKEFAQMLNVSTHTIANYEQGQRGSNTNTLKKIAKALEVSTDELLVEKHKEEMKSFANSWNSKTEEERNSIINKTKEKWETEEKETIINTIINIADKADTIDFFLNEDSTMNYEKSKQMFDIFVNTMKLITNNSDKNK